MAQPSLEALPIDIHYNKLLDWLTNRRHCTQQCQAILTGIRDKQVKAKAGTEEEGFAKTQAIKDFLSLPQLNFFQVKKLVDLLSKTDAGKTNLIGQYSQQCMKDWWEILKLYEKDGTYLTETTNAIIRNVNYEIPAIKKQISKCQQTQKDCLRKEGDCNSSAAELRKQYNSSCKQIGIEGLKIKTELSLLIKDLPKELCKFAESAKSLNEAVDFYDSFTEFVVSKASASGSNVLLLKHLLSKGNTTTFEWRTGHVPKQVQDQDITFDLSDEQDTMTGEAEDIDWGAMDGGESIDFSIDFGDITVESGGVLAADGAVVLENPDIDTIDWDAVVEGEAENPVDDDVDIAAGKDALSIIDNPETRNLFIDDLLELQAFLTQRMKEMSHGSADANHLTSAPLEVNIEPDQVTSMMSQVKVILDQLTSVQMQHLLLIRDSPRYVDRLRDSLRQKLASADKMVMNEKETAAVRRAAEEEGEALKPQLDVLKAQTKDLKLRLEEEITKKYNGRKVNVIGEVNTL